MNYIFFGPANGRIKLIKQILKKNSNCWDLQ